MKVSPTPDYTVRVRRMEYEVPTDNATLYRGTFEVALNQYVTIRFVPDVSSFAPPWDARVLPENIDTIETTELARVAAVLLSSYAVTPNDTLAGTEEQIGWHSPDPLDEPGFVYYVKAEEFARFSADLDALTEIAHNLHSRVRVSDLRDREVVAFIERRIVASPLLKPRHTELLEQRR
jgi:hypothetical protein